MIVWADSSAGTHTATNQDSVFAELLRDPVLGRLVFAVVADGMGGMQCGDVASAIVIDHFAAWARRTDLSQLDSARLWQEWGDVIGGAHQAISATAESRGITMGSTVTVLLVTATYYYLANVGDTRCYEITDTIRQLTEDHSLVAQEMRRGNLNAEQARVDPRQNVLLQCVGMASQPRPDYFTGPSRDGAKYLICTDGMRHEVTDGELFEVLAAGSASQEQLVKLIELNRARGETDDISAVLVQTSPQGGTSPLVGVGSDGAEVVR